MNRAIDTIEYERDFKVLCDGLLRFELGALLQTFGSDGSDGGVDAQFDGAIEGIPGRWVFQYKFRSPKEAISRRRSWLQQRYVGSKGKPSEFDKKGVKGADGYILLTNIPITAAAVRSLTSEWRKREHDGRFCVWDPSRLDALLKGHEHLARSWSGAKEAHCLQAVIIPLWQWLQAAQAATLNWKFDPLWPLEVQPHQRPVTTGAFHKSIGWTHGLSIVPRTGALHHARSDPQFHYASTIVYRRALQPLQAVLAAVEALGHAILLPVDALRDELVERLPQLQQLRDVARAEATRALAYCVLENRWGFPMRGLHSIRDGKLLVHGQYYAWNEPAISDIEGALDGLVRAAPHGEVDAAVTTARVAVEALVQDWWRLLWPVVFFGIDAEPEQTAPP